jgi:hypothetical protein
MSIENESFPRTLLSLLILCSLFNTVVMCMTPGCRASVVWVEGRGPLVGDSLRDCDIDKGERNLPDRPE